MDTQVRTPQLVFMQPQRLIVPLFQRPYVWNQENQWEPLWNDVIRVAERVIAEPGGSHQPHFLGAVVLQQSLNQVGSLQTRTVIDGQQRLTTLQLLLDALHAELVAVGADQPAMRIEALVVNPPAFCTNPEDKFKVWPTNRDRPAFNCAMDAELPVAYDTLEHRGERLVQGHRFFAERARAWLQANGEEEISTRAARLEHAVRELLQLVVIDLTADENAQEIFETLNARGAQLTAADLIKNFVFQRLMEQGVEVEPIYEEYWKEFETGFWETEVSFGRLKYSRSSIFLNHWLIARTGEEIVAREVFARFKHYADFEADVPMAELVAQLHRASVGYREFIEAAVKGNPITRVELFAYRSSVLESEVFKPVVLWLFDPEQEPVDPEELLLAWDALESWMVRRMLVRAQTSSYTQIAAELVTQLLKGDRSRAGHLIQDFFAGQTVGSRYWPDNNEVMQALSSMPVYLRLRRGRLRMVLEAAEDHARGWKGSSEGLGGERVARNKYHIEHVMPRTWQPHWPLGDESEADRDHLVHTLGNLTLLTSKLNTKVSNSAWSTKRDSLVEHDVLKLNSLLLAFGADSWTDAKVRARTVEMSRQVLEIWPVPPGHKSAFASAEERPRRRVNLADLISVGLLEPGTVLYARRKAHLGRTVIVLPDGRLDLDGIPYDTPTAAARAISGNSENGWAYFVLEPGSKRSLDDLFQEYVEMTSGDGDEEIADVETDGASADADLGLDDDDDGLALPLEDDDAAETELEERQFEASKGEATTSMSESEFHAAMVDIYRSAKSEAGYNATRFIQMVSAQGGVATAQQLLRSDTVSEGFTALWEAQRLDLTVEALVISGRCDDLFTYEERAIADRRLRDYGFQARA